MASIKIKLVRGLAGCQKNQIATAKALGLRTVGSETVQPDNAATRGKIRVISHLVTWNEV